MKIHEIIKTDAVTIPIDATIQKAAHLMHDLHVGSLAVIENEHLVGIITDRDICCRVTALGLDAVLTRVKNIMTGNVTTIFDDQDIDDAAHLMADHHIRHLAVLKHDNTMAGLISVDDLANGSHDLASEVLESATPMH